MRVLISGAGIAGPALAYWLRHHGAEATIVERAPAPRPGGQALDVRGAALDVVDRMGRLGDLRKARTRMRGSSMLAADGTELFRSTEFAPSSGRLDSDDVEILRDDLVALLAGAAGGADLRYGEAIAGLEQDADGVDVRLRGGTTERFDLVVGADGLHSAVRRAIFPDAVPHHLGAYVAVYTAPNDLGLDEWQVWLRDDRTGAGAGIYTARDNRELRVNVGFMSGPVGYDRHDLDAQRRLVHERCAGLGWEIPRLLAAMDAAPDFYFDAMAQVRLDAWSSGRVTLLGDAGYCPSPLSGQGTSLALVGAYVLAEELARAGAGGLAAYEARMRPFVELNQALATENPGGPAAPESIDRAKTGITL
ncbi:FAD-dependent monooxygenase [Dactylosporangium sp. NPDC049140]|uniref:FAD-dependent monooxygenase n=1 Tax=Dactylosporangium sp. NPDC049140 TaxID=3155647 RepID=UPI00340580B6